MMSSSSNPLCLGVEIGGTKLQIVKGDSAGVVERWRADVKPHARGEDICRQIGEGVDQLMKSSRPAAIGVGFGGPVDGRRGRVRVSHQIEGWADFPLADWLRERSGLPVVLENDANTAALGEATFGAGRGADPVFYVTLGSGVGGGLVAGGSIYHGRPPGEAEFGHVRLDRSGATVESRCSGWAIDGRIRALRAAGESGPLMQAAATVERGEAKFLPAALERNDPLARQILSELADDLGFALSHVIHLFHPQVIVIGGGLSHIGEPLRAAVAESLTRNVMAAFQPAPDVRLAGLAEDAVPRGALELARRAI